MKKYFIIFFLLISLFLVSCKSENKNEGNGETNKTPTQKTVVQTKYTISYDLDGGVCEEITGDATVEFESASEITLPIPTKEGFTFEGWYEGNTKVTKIENKNYNLKASWSNIKLQIKVINKANNEEIDSFYINYGETIDISFFTKYIESGLNITSVDESLINLKEDTTVHCDFEEINNAIIFVYKENKIICKTYNLSFIGILVEFDISEECNVTSKYTDASIKNKDFYVKFIYTVTENTDKDKELFTIDKIVNIVTPKVEAYYYNESGELVEILVDAYIVK